MLKNYLKKNWTQFIGTELPANVQLVPISSCTDEYGNDIILLFIEAESYPRYVMKICRNSQYNSKLENEYSALRHLMGTAKINSKIPTPFHLGRWEDKVFFLQEGLAGISLYSLIKERGLNKKTFASVEESIDLLIQINHVQITGKSNIAEDFLSDFESVLSNASVCQAQISRIKDEREIFLKEGRCYFTQGDYWPRNILVDKKTKNVAGIIDWEFSISRSPFPIDCMWFLLNLGYCLALKNADNTSIMEAFKSTFFSQGKHNDFICACYNRYALRIGIDKDSFFPLLEILLVEMSLREYRAYGKHMAMDFVCLDMLKYLHSHKDTLVLNSVSG